MRHRSPFSGCPPGAPCLVLLPPFSEVPLISSSHHEFRKIPRTLAPSVGNSADEANANHGKFTTKLGKGQSFPRFRTSKGPELGSKAGTQEVEAKKVIGDISHCELASIFPNPEGAKHIEGDEPQKKGVMIQSMS
ncbi:hypothetical protein PIB30_096955 [Stylosanthes scabra]|uniref:Uncharacterized protein n=1 Tax=Stylosanthes scabra TaxID=79078 RepID=A0ABU6UWD5_9FABA|nr:hypothetical protein [Stylosanthes scabra]